jgi:hypothetical protein
MLDAERRLNFAKITAQGLTGRQSANGQSDDIPQGYAVGAVECERQLGRVFGFDFEIVLVDEKVFKRKRGSRHPAIQADVQFSVEEAIASAGVESQGAYIGRGRFDAHPARVAV